MRTRKSERNANSGMSQNLKPERFDSISFLLAFSSLGVPILSNTFSLQLSLVGRLKKTKLATMNLLFGLCAFLLTAAIAQGFVAPKPLHHRTILRRLEQQEYDAKLHATPASSSKQEGEMTFSDEDRLDVKLRLIASHLKLQVYDPDTSVFGFDSKDRFHGIENVRVSIPIDPSEPSLGLDLSELAHGEYDSRGLVLVSGISGNAAKAGRIQLGDTIIGVFVGKDFKESTTALNFDETMGILQDAKDYAKTNGSGTIDLELNRLVRREHVKVIIEEDWRDDHGDLPVAKELDALAGDNLRSLLMHRHLRVYDDRTVRLDTLGTGDCGGEGICGTCLVEVLEGMETLNPKGPQETEITTGRPANWRASCKTVVGADNISGTTLRIRLHPQSSVPDQLLHPGKKNPKLHP